jgi:hypothetical protein
MIGPGIAGRVLRARQRGTWRPAIQKVLLRGDNGRVRSRYLAIGAAVWATGYTAVYAAVVTGQGNWPAWWYLALLAAGAGALAVAATRRWPRPVLIFGAACLALAALAGIASIGMFLVPAVVAAAVAAAGTSQRPPTSETAR